MLTNAFDGCSAVLLRFKIRTAKAAFFQQHLVRMEAPTIYGRSLDVLLVR